MSFKVFATDYLSGYGYGVVILTVPVLSANTHTIECHAFFSGRLDSYSLTTLSFDSEVTQGVSDSDLAESALAQGKEHIHSILSAVSQIQYQGMLAGFGFSFREKDKSHILQLHLRNFLSPDLEQRIESSSADRDLRSFMATVRAAGRITSERKI
ncbi:hypothetical protein BJL95_01900 [Methylomonas sp. LWB]|uniref:hypothetical protein n=1 Tax=Methylomonas sp. LWB TaxID=1905845 RepID=UPI0008D938D6|nr:hypothetical protein [Methylomonas sp. LWB]OHX35317.1 hypothetical protein BJL95_01900 [Methylomonas sp. LWB]